MTALQNRRLVKARQHKIMRFLKKLHPDIKLPLSGMWRDCK
jgi:hypothetical protein